MSVLIISNDNPEYQKFPRFLKDFANYLVGVEGRSKKTVAEYLLDLRTFFRYKIMIDNDQFLSLEELEKLSIRDLKIEDAVAVKRLLILNFIGYLKLDRNNNASTSNRKLSALRKFYKYLKKEGYIDTNPTDDISTTKKKKTISKYLTAEEAVMLISAVNSDVDSKTRQRDYSIIVLFLNTGMRLAELVGLNIQSFDRDITMAKVLGKGNKERIIYLNSAAQDAVKSYMQIRLDPRFIRTSDKAFFLSTRQQRISPKTVQWVVNKYLDLAGLGGRGYSVHKLRHTAATLMYQSGKVDIRVLKDVLGHEQLTTTEIYTHIVNKNLEDAMEHNPLADVVLKRPIIDSADE